MNSATTCLFNLSLDLPPATQKKHISNEIDKSLVSVPVLCDARCKAVFGEHNLQVIKDNKIKINGERNSTTNLWLM